MTQFVIMAKGAGEDRYYGMDLSGVGVKFLVPLEDAMEFDDRQEAEDEAWALNGSPRFPDQISFYVKEINEDQADVGPAQENW